MLEQRLSVRLLKYWERIKKDELFPDFKKNNPAMIEDLWPQCLVVSLTAPNSSAYRYDYLGQKVIEAYGRDLTGAMVDLHAIQFPEPVIAPKLRVLVQEKTPQSSEGQTLGNRGKFVKYRAILLPFGDEHRGVTHVLAGISFREF